MQEGWFSFSGTPITVTGYQIPNCRGSPIRYGCSHAQVHPWNEMMSWHDLKWSPSEKKVARAAYDAAVQAALARVMAEFKQKAAAVSEPADMWDLEIYLRDQRRDIDAMFQYSYAQLPLTFVYAIRKGYLDEGRLKGLADDKLSLIRAMLAQARR